MITIRNILCLKQMRKIGSSRASQCLSDRRIGDIVTLQSEIAAWAARTNSKQRAVDWQFTIEKARIKLKRLYPKI